MGLDRDCKTMPYLAGRVLAVLNKAEINTVGASAHLATEANYREMLQLPRATFGKLMQLRSVRGGLTGVLDKEMMDIISLMPATGLQQHMLSPDERALASVGYRHELGYLDSL